VAGKSILFNPKKGKRESESESVGLETRESSKLA
jgi:hypothetical protein